MNELAVTHKELGGLDISGSYRILHITDAHITLWDERDEERMITSGAHAGKRVVDFAKVRYPHFSRDGVTSNERFQSICEYLAAHHDFCDAVAFSGDILDFYTEAAFTFMCSCLDKLPMPYLFALGNHDLIFSGMQPDEVRAKFLGICGGNTRVQKLKVGELALIGVDDIANRYTDETLADLKTALEGEKCAMVFQHVPLCCDSLHESSMAAAGRDLSLGEKAVNVDDSWRVFRDILTAEASPVAALICGDTHRENEGIVEGGLKQFVSPIVIDHPPVLFTLHG